MHTSIYAGFLGLLLVALSINVISERRHVLVALGDDAQHELKRRIRAHGNLTEYAPIFLILLGLAEYNGLPWSGVHAFGLVFCAGRVMHAYSVLRAEQYIDGKLTARPIWRSRGMKCTLNSIMVLAALVLVQGLAGWFI